MTVLVVLALATLWLLPIPIAFIGYQYYDALDPEGRPIPVSAVDPVYDFIVIGAGSAGNFTNFVFKAILGKPQLISFGLSTLAFCRRRNCKPPKRKSGLESPAFRSRWR